MEKEEKMDDQKVGQESSMDQQPSPDAAGPEVEQESSMDHQPSPDAAGSKVEQENSKDQQSSLDAAGPKVAQESAMDQPLPDPEPKVEQESETDQVLPDAGPKVEQERAMDQQPSPDGGAPKAGQDSAMDQPLPDPGPLKEDVPLFCCDLCDKETVHKIAQLLNPGLAAACVDNTTGLFRGPASVAVPIRKEMVDYVTQRSETYVAETMVQNEDTTDPVEEVSDDPADIVSDLVDDFAGSKRNFFSRVSGWILSDSREDKIDDFVQEMETNVFWPIDRREVIAETLLRNVDFKNAYHCSMKFESEEQLAEHKENCSFRIMECTNEGCRVKFSAGNAEKHDMECPYKILPCEQKCPVNIVRREMDRHCVTVCPMKMVNCPFYQIGCQSAFPQCSIEKHCSEFLRSHLIYVLRVIHKQELSEEELEQRAQLLEKSECQSELCEALDVRSLTMAVKEQEAKMKKYERGLSIVPEES